MAPKSQRKITGPRIPWQRKVRYQRARCIERLKPNQIESLAAADMFARWRGTPLNWFVTIHFHKQPNPKLNLKTSIDRLSKWHRRWGGEWAAIHVWEATGGFHVHMACHCPQTPDAVHAAIRNAFAGYDVHIRARTRGQGMMAYLCKGTDIVSHSKIRGPRTIKARRQGIIPWKRCGTTQNLGKRSREGAGFEAGKSPNNCVKTSPCELNASASQWTGANAHGGIGGCFPTSIVSKVANIPLRDTGDTGMSEGAMSNT